MRGTAGATIAGRLTFENVYRTFDDMDAVHNFSLDISPGEVLCLLGPSGCGKTTLLRLAAGIEQPSAGHILLNGKEVSGPNKFVLPEQRSVGLMFQDFALFPHLRIIDNVAFGLKSLAKAEAKRVALAGLERVGLAQYANDYPHILSGGQQQRVALARAMAPRPSVLLMDEPFSGLDPRLRETMRDETLAILHETRATCIIVTHQTEEAMRMGDRIGIMNKGHLLQADTAQRLYSHPKNIFVARMFSEINEIKCVVKDGVVDTPLGQFPAQNLKTGTSGFLCIRKSDIEIGKTSDGVLGRVLQHKFLGDTALLEIAISGLDMPLIAKVRQAVAPQVGQDIGVTIAPDRVLVFAVEDV